MVWGAWTKAHASPSEGASWQDIPNLGIFMPNMGLKTPPSRSLGLVSVLFTGTQQRLLALLFGQPTRRFYASELIGLAGMGSGAVQRELAKLAGSGLVTVRAVGNQKHYQANASSPSSQGVARRTT